MDCCGAHASILQAMTIDVHRIGTQTPLNKIRLVRDLERIRRPGAPILQSEARAQARETLAVGIHRADVREPLPRRVKMMRPGLGSGPGWSHRRRGAAGVRGKRRCDAKGSWAEGGSPPNGPAGE